MLDTSPTKEEGLELYITHLTKCREIAKMRSKREKRVVSMSEVARDWFDEGYDKDIITYGK